MKKELKGIDGKVAIHCTTQEEYTQVLDLIPMDAKKRESMNFGFGKYGNETCIADYGLCYGRIDFWKSEGYTIITAAEFIAMNTEPEADKERELLEAFRDYLKTRGIWSWTVEIDNFLSSLRKPAFELITADGVVTDPEQRVYYVEGMDICGNLAQFAQKDLTCFTTESAAVEHRLHNTAAIKLSDMIYDASTGYYVIHKEGAHNLVNERINGK